MKVAIFNSGEEYVTGFLSEDAARPDEAWIFEKYHTFELDESEVKELRDAFSVFQKAQHKLDEILGKRFGYSTQEIERFKNDNFSRNR